MGIKTSAVVVIFGVVNIVVVALVDVGAVVVVADEVFVPMVVLVVVDAEEVCSVMVVNGLGIYGVVVGDVAAPTDIASPIALIVCAAVFDVIGDGILAVANSVAGAVGLVFSGLVVVLVICSAKELDLIFVFEETGDMLLIIASSNCLMSKIMCLPKIKTK